MACTMQCTGDHWYRHPCRIPEPAYETGDCGHDDKGDPGSAPMNMCGDASGDIVCFSCTGETVISLSLQAELLTQARDGQAGPGHTRVMLSANGRSPGVACRLSIGRTFCVTTPTGRRK
jgi:hypothetical protein